METSTFFAQPKWINEEFFDLRPGRLDAAKEGGQILDQRVRLQPELVVV